jgi:hypothetical protein
VASDNNIVFDEQQPTIHLYRMQTIGERGCACSGEMRHCERDEEDEREEEEEEEK